MVTDRAATFRRVMRLTLTGRVAVRAGDDVLGETALAGRLGRMVLVRLALARYPIGRHRLIDDLWGEQPPAAVDSVLNATFSRLRSALSSLGLDGRGIVHSSGGTAELRLPPGSRVDVHTALQEIDRAEGALRRNDCSTAWSGAVVAHAIARRPLLPDVERDWLDPERDRLHHVHERSLAVLTEMWTARGDHQQAAVMARELVRVAPFAEGAHERLVRALLAAGDTPAAVAAVQRWETVLTEDLGLSAENGLRRLLTGA